MTAFAGLIWIMVGIMFGIPICIGIGIFFFVVGAVMLNI